MDIFDIHNHLHSNKNLTHKIKTILSTCHDVILPFCEFTVSRIWNSPGWRISSRDVTSGPLLQHASYDMELHGKTLLISWRAALIRSKLDTLSFLREMLFGRLKNHDSPLRASDENLETYQQSIKQYQKVAALTSGQVWSINYKNSMMMVYMHACPQHPLMYLNLRLPHQCYNPPNSLPQCSSRWCGFGTPLCFLRHRWNWTVALQATPNKWKLHRVKVGEIKLIDFALNIDWLLGISGS